MSNNQQPTESKPKPSYGFSDISGIISAWIPIGAKFLNDLKTISNILSNPKLNKQL